jgi:hypothetical protein
MSRDSQSQALRNWVLRLAFVVAAGLVIETLRGAPLPPLAPALALQILAASRIPPGKMMVFMLFLIAAGTSGVAYLVAIMTVEHFLLYAIGVGLLYLWGFFLAFQKGTALVGVLAITMTVMVTSLANTSTGVASDVILSLLLAILIGFALVFLAYTAFPSPPGIAGPAAQEQADQGAARTMSISQRALLATIVILPAHLYLNFDGTAAMVVLLTMGTMLRQPGLAQSTRFCMAFVAGNALGGILAALVVFFLTLHDQVPTLITLTGAAALILSWLITYDKKLAPVVLPGFVAFTVLFGLVLSPLPFADDVDVVNRVLLIVAGALYCVAFVSLLVPFLSFFARFAGSGAAGAS